MTDLRALVRELKADLEDVEPAAGYEPGADADYASAALFRLSLGLDTLAEGLDEMHAAIEADNVNGMLAAWFEP